MDEESKDIAYYKTPLGTAKIIGDKNGINSISVQDEEIESSKTIPNSLKDCIIQLEQYFENERTEFDL